MSEEDQIKMEGDASEPGTPQTGRPAIPVTPRRRQSREEMLALKEKRRRQLHNLSPEAPEATHTPPVGEAEETSGAAPPADDEQPENSLVRLKRGVMSGGGVAPPRFARRRRSRSESDRAKRKRPHHSHSRSRRWLRHLGKKFLRLDSLWLIPLAAVILIVAFQVLDRLPERGGVQLPDSVLFQSQPPTLESKVAMPNQSPPSSASPEPSAAKGGVESGAGAIGLPTGDSTRGSAVAAGSDANVAESENARGLFLGAQALAEAGRIDEAMAGMNQALAHDPLFTPAVRALYSLHGMRNNPEQLIEFGRRLVALEPGNTSVLLDIARRLDASGRSIEAVELIDAHAGAALSDMSVLTVKVQAMRRAGVAEGEILDAFEKDAPLGGDTPAADILHLILRDAAGRTDGIAQAIEHEAARIDTGNLSNDPAMARMAVSLAVLAATHGLPNISERLNYDVIESGSPDAKFAANDLAYRLAKADDRLEEAQRLAVIALEADPDSEAFIDTMAVIQLKLGRPHEAVAAFESRIDPAQLRSPVARRTLAEAYRAAGREDDAARMLEGGAHVEAP